MFVLEWVYTGLRRVTDMPANGEHYAHYVRLLKYRVG